MSDLLEGMIAQHSLEDLRRYYANSLRDWAETDTYVKKKASEVLTQQQIDGDGYAFQGVEEIVDILVEELKTSRNNQLPDA